jgi:hypothetical protein
MRKINNLLALLLVFLLLFSSCAESTSLTLATVGTQKSTDATTTASKTTASTKNPSPYDIEEDVNFRGETFTFAILTDYEDLSGYGICETENDPINAAIKERNEYIYDTFNGKTETVKMSASALNGALEAGNCAVDFVYAPYGAVNTKYCYDTESLGVDFAMPWWNSVTTQMSVGGKSYAMAGAFSLETYDSYEIIFFSKEVKGKITSLKKQDIYEFVYDSEWTIDTLFELSKLAYSEANANGFISEKNGISALYFAAGQKFISQTENGGATAFISGFNDAAKSVTDKIISVFGDSSVKVGEKAEALSALAEGKPLFAKATIGDMKKFAEEEINYGVLPIPGTEKTQSFVNCVSADTPFIFALKSGASPEHMKYYLWYFAYFSYTTVYRDYMNLRKYQYTTDTDSATIIDLCIKSSVSYDITRFYGWSGAEEKYISAVLAGENPIENFRTELYPELEAKAKEYLENLG